MDPLSIAGTASGLLKALKGLGKGRTQVELQLTDNGFAWNGFLAGNPAGLEFLKGRGGLGNTKLSAALAVDGKPYVAGTTIGPWNNAQSQQDAADKYAKLISSGAGVPVAAGIPKLADGSTIGQSRTGSGVSTDNVPFSAASLIPADAVKSLLPALLVGGVIVGLVLMTKGGKR